MRRSRGERGGGREERGEEEGLDVMKEGRRQQLCEHSASTTHLVHVLCCQEILVGNKKKCVEGTDVSVRVMLGQVSEPVREAAKEGKEE